MKNGQSLAVGAFLAAALLLRPTGSGPPQGTDTGGIGARADTGSVAPPALQVGPWIASCSYWASTRIARAEPPESPPEVQGTLGPNGQISLHVGLDATEEKQAAGCSSGHLERWGIPNGAANGAASVTAIIATVPDPVHTHLALAFDRTVEAILQAAADNNYVSSYYWLPWRTRHSGLKLVESAGDFEPGHDPERERQPGLMILRPASADPPDSFIRVIYLFLVAETPTQGVDGFQLQNAFLYETDLRKALRDNGGQFSTGAAGHLSIIGPQYSGSAASLRAGIDAVQKNQRLGATEFEVTGASTTRLPVRQLESSSLGIPYLSFGDNRDYDTEALIRRIDLSNYDRERVALLVEDNTAFSAAEGTSWELWKGAKVISFPREISLLRNAQATDSQTGTSAPSSGPFSPYLHFSLKDYSAQDSIPQFSRENTPLSQEAVLMTIARQLHRYRAQFIAIVASNSLDQIFLAQFLHRACPDARLLFFVADLLMAREVDNVPFIGSITITPYPLIGLEAKPNRTYRTHPDSESEAFYNAASFTFWRISPGVELKKLFLQGYHALLAPNGDQPFIWATALGRDGYYPLAILSPSASDHFQFLPTFAKGGNAVPESRDVKPARLVTFVLHPSLLWSTLCAIISLLCISHAVMLLVAGYGSPLTRDLAVRENDQPRRRSTYIHVATATLSSMAFVVSFPVLWLACQARVSQTSVAAGMLALDLGVVMAAVSVWKTWGYIGWGAPRKRPRRGPVLSVLPSPNGTVSHRKQPSPWKRVRRTYRRIRASAYLLLDLAALALSFGVPALWAYLCCAEYSMANSAKLPGEHPYLVGFSFCYRSIHPDSGVSPLVPVLLLLFGWYSWGIFQTLRLRFSASARPRLPKHISGVRGIPLFVADETLQQAGSIGGAWLYRNMTCPLITREMAYRCVGLGAGISGRSRRRKRLTIDVAAVFVYIAALMWFAFFARVRGLDHFLWNTGDDLSCPYEVLVCLLFFPLIFASLTSPVCG